MLILIKLRFKSGISYVCIHVISNLNIISFLGDEMLPNYCYSVYVVNKILTIETLVIRGQTSPPRGIVLGILFSKTLASELKSGRNGWPFQSKALR